MDGRRIAISKTGLVYSIGRYHRLVSPRAPECLYVLAPIHTAAIPITANCREKSRPSHADQSDQRPAISEVTASRCELTHGA